MNTPTQHSIEQEILDNTTAETRLAAARWANAQTNTTIETRQVKNTPCLDIDTHTETIGNTWITGLGLGLGLGGCDCNTSVGRNNWCAHMVAAAWTAVEHPQRRAANPTIETLTESIRATLTPQGPQP